MRFHKADAASLVKAATDAPLTKIASGANSIAAIQKISDRIQAENALVKKNAKKKGICYRKEGSERACRRKPGANFNLNGHGL